MFGKGKKKMSVNDRAVMAAGRANGNLKFEGSRGGKGGAKGEETPDPFRKRDVSAGRGGPMKFTRNG